MDAAVGTKTAYIERGSRWENGYIESFNARLRDELLNGEIFYSLREAQIVIESWRRHYNKMRPPRLTWNQAISAGGVRARLRQRGRQPMVPTDARSALSVVRCKTLPFFLLKLS
jgi:transposase InsO family protein